MPCDICHQEFDDHVSRKNLMLICNQSHSVCRECSDKMMVCHKCNGIIEKRQFCRVNNKRPVREPHRKERKKQPTMIFLLDISGSMYSRSCEREGAPSRIEMAVHLVKVMLEFCRTLSFDFRVSTFSDDVQSVEIHKDTSVAECEQVLSRLRPQGETKLGLALSELYDRHGPNNIYFVFTDGHPTDETKESVRRYEGTQLHLFCFGADVSIPLMKQVASSSFHTVSYIEDIRSIAGYIVPVFIWAATGQDRSELSVSDDTCRKKYVELLRPHVTKQESSQKCIDSLMDMLTKVQPITAYVRDLIIDTKGDTNHSRVEYSYESKNWDAFGRFYLLCILHCHQHLIPGNSFDPSLHHYRSSQYRTTFEKLSKVSVEGIQFHAFMCEGNEEEAVAASVSAASMMSQAFSFSDCYLPAPGEHDGCIAGDASIYIVKDDKKTKIQVKDLKTGDTCENGARVKWIVKIHHLCNGGPVTLYNGFTPSHPVLYKHHWIRAIDYPNAVKSTTTDPVFDIALNTPLHGHVTVNDINCAVLGYPVPGFVHPYYGSNRIIEHLQSRCPDGGIVTVDARDFSFSNGLVSNIFT